MKAYILFSYKNHSEFKKFSLHIVYESIEFMFLRIHLLQIIKKVLT